MVLLGSLMVGLCLGVTLDETMVHSECIRVIDPLTVFCVSPTPPKNLFEAQQFRRWYFLPQVVDPKMLPSKRQPIKKSLWHLVRLLKPTGWSSKTASPWGISIKFNPIPCATSWKMPRMKHWKLYHPWNSVTNRPWNRPSAQNERILSQPSMSSGAMAVTFRECRNLIPVLFSALKRFRSKLCVEK